MPLGLYVHIPFCPYKCSYCDFYKELFDSRRQQQFFKALLVETELAANTYAPIDNEISTIFIGGGTPSMINLELFAEWLQLLKKHFYVPDGIEFSFENNPDSVTVEQMQFIQNLGVTRPTIGIQSFHSSLLKKLNRPHTITDSQKAVYLAHTLEFKSFGVDIIFGLPAQTNKMLSQDLDQIVELSPPHISYYQLTVEPKTRLHDKVEQGRLTLPDEDEMLAMYKAGCEKFLEAGYERYEVSSFAKPGHQCQHNLGYWEGKDYLGLGPSAHSFMYGRRFANVPDIVTYCQRLERGERPLIEDQNDTGTRITETIMLGLRTARGIDRELFSQRFGMALDDQLDRRQYEALVESGHVIPEDGMVRLSDDGLYLADEITRRLLR